MDKLLIEPLNEKQYADVFNVFMNRSHEYESMIEFLVSEFNKHNRQLQILSLGAGTGYFDKKVIDRLIIKPSYTALEPNPVYIEQIKETLPDAKIIQDYFTLTYNTIERYDYIIFSHSLYCISEPWNIINYATNFLMKDGKVIVFHQSERGMYQFVSKFNNYLTFNEKPYADHTYSAKDIAKKLNNNCKHNRLSGYIDMSDVFGDKEILHKMLSFFMQTDTNKLPEWIVNEMVNELKANMRDNKYIHPVDILLINKNSSF
jgi:phospholipid N-methyltransferase